MNTRTRLVGIMITLLIVAVTTENTKYQSAGLGHATSAVSAVHGVHGSNGVCVKMLKRLIHSVEMTQAGIEKSMRN